MWWCAPHYQKGMPHSVARGRSQSIFCTINVLHCTTQALQSFVSFFHKCKSTGHTPQLSFVRPQGWRDNTLVGKFLASLMDRWDVIAHHQESRKPILMLCQAFWEALKNQSHRICGPCASNQIETEKTNKLDSIGPTKNQQKTLDVHGPKAQMTQDIEYFDSSYSLSSKQKLQ